MSGKSEKAKGNCDAVTYILRKQKFVFGDKNNNNIIINFLKTSKH